MSGSSWAFVLPMEKGYEEYFSAFVLSELDEGSYWMKTVVCTARLAGLVTGLFRD